MNKCFLITSFILSTLFSQAQNFGDTISIQTLEFSDITKRRGWYIFPSDTNQYHKILMYYTLKCDGATTQDNYPCGEWDYTTYTKLYKHKNYNAPYYYLQNSTPDTIYYNNNPSYDLIQYYDYNIVYDNIISESTYSLGAGGANITEPFNTSMAASRGQYLFTEAELLAGGLNAGDINKIIMDISSTGEEIKTLTIQLKHTALTELTPLSYENDSLFEVYSSNNAGMLNGQQVFNFNTPFNWDGVSNLIVDLSFTNNYSDNSYNGINDYQLLGDDYSSNIGILTGENGCLDFAPLLLRVSPLVLHHLLRGHYHLP